MKNIKKISLIILLTLICVMLINISISYASVAIIPSSTLYNNITASDAYAVCKTMRETTLGINNLDSHLSTNLDWGACSYLATSDYGDRNLSKVTSKVTENGEEKNIEFTSTTGNESGVMNFGRNLTFTSGIMTQQTTTTNDTDNIFRDRNTKYVDLLTASNGIVKDYAMASLQYFGTDVRCSISMRRDLYIFTAGIWANVPAAASNKTFRPVIWNK